MSRRGSARGSAALAGLVGVLVFLVVVMVYYAGQNSISLSDIPSLLTVIPLWFYIAIGIVAAAFAGVALREPRTSRESDIETDLRVRPTVEPRVQVFEPIPLAGLGATMTPPKREVLLVASPVPPKPVILARPSGPPAMKTTFAPKAAPPVAIRPAAPPETTALVQTESMQATPVVNPEPPAIRTPEPEPAPQAAPAPAIESRPADVRPAPPEPDILAEESTASEPMPEPEVALEDLESWLEETSPEALAARKKRLLRRNAQPPA